MAKSPIKHTNGDAPTAHTGYEVTDLGARGIFAFVAFMIGLMLVSMVILVVYLNSLEAEAAAADESLSPLIESQATPTGPRLQARPPLDMQAMDEMEEAILTSYGWVDEENGVVRIPIEQAMERVVEQGLPVREGP